MPGNFRCWLRPPLSDRAAPVRSACLIRHHPVQQRYSRQALRLFAHRQNPFRARRHKIFKIWRGRQPSWGPCGESGGEGTFFRGAGRESRARQGSISSSRRATAGVQISTDLELGPLFGLNAVRTFQARVPGAERGARALGWPALSPPGPKSDQIGPNPVIDAECLLFGAKRTYLGHDRIVRL